MTTKVIVRDSFTDVVTRTVKLFCGIVKVTLGPRGRNVIIHCNDLSGKPRITKDGVTVAMSIALEDESENAIVQLLCEASKTLNNKEGDGTTSCLVLLQAIIENSIHDVRMNEKIDINEYFRGMDKAIEMLISYIQNRTVMIKGNAEKVKQIAMIASNGDEKYAQFIATAYEKIGKYGSISCHEGHGNEPKLEMVEGMTLDRGYVSQYFVTKTDKMVCELENPFILIYDKKISSFQSMLKPLDESVKHGRPLLIISEDLDGDALSHTVVNKLRGVIKVCAIKAPGFGERRSEMLEDIAILTGGKVISSEKGDLLENIENWGIYFGSAKTVTVGKDSTVIVDGNGCKDAIQERIMMIQNQFANSTSDYDREKLQERISKLSDGVAKINVSAPTESEMKETKDRVDDAIHATKSAVENGVVQGAGLCIARGARFVLSNINPLDYSSDYMRGVQAITRACDSIFLQILTNGYIDNSALIMHNILSHQDENYGYDVRNNVYGDMYNMGIIDASNVVRTIVQVAYSVSKNILQSMVIVADKKEEASANSAGVAHRNPMMGMDY